MDSKTNLSELKEIIKVFCEERDWDKYHNAKDLAIGIITEASELLEQFRFKSEAEMLDMFENEDKRRQIVEEMADVFYFLLRLAQMYEIDLTLELTKKMAINKEKYPINKSKGSNKKYTEL